MADLHIETGDGLVEDYLLFSYIGGKRGFGGWTWHLDERAARVAWRRRIALQIKILHNWWAHLERTVRQAYHLYNEVWSYLFLDEHFLFTINVYEVGASTIWHSISDTCMI
jgi:hypothetical protein